MMTFYFQILNNRKKTQLIFKSKNSFICRSALHSAMYEVDLRCASVCFWKFPVSSTSPQYLSIPFHLSLYSSVSLHALPSVSILFSISPCPSICLYTLQYLSMPFHLSLYSSVSLHMPQCLSYSSISLRILLYLSMWWRIPPTFNIFLYSCRTKASWDYYNQIKDQELASVIANNTNNKQSLIKNINNNNSLNNWIITSIIRIIRMTLALLISLFPSLLELVLVDRWWRRYAWTRPIATYKC